MDSDSVVCRLCLEIVPTAYSLLKEDILSTVNALTSINISDNDNLPKLSCSKCIYNLYFVDSIRKLIIKSDERLREIYLRDGNFNELFERSYPIEEGAEEHDFPAVEIKEEKVIPVINDFPMIEDCDNSTRVEHDTKTRKTKKLKKNCKVSVNDENNKSISGMIYRKNDEKPYLYHCNVCNVDFRGNKLYLAHKGKHTKKTCEICGVTTRQDNFNKHMTNHTLGQQICDICGSIHKSLEGLRTHLFHFHNAKKKLYCCDMCGEKFKYSHRLSYHKRKIHTGFRPHQCENCGKRFFDLGTMKKHVKLIHLKLREYPCKYCQKDYSSGYALKVHMRQHTDETPYVCEFCSEGFRQLVSLKTHLARYHKDKPSTSQTDQEDVQEEEATVRNDEFLPQV